MVISATENARGVQRHVPRENFEFIDAIWCVLMYHCDQIKSKKVPLFIMKNDDYRYAPCYTLAMGYFAPREI